MATGHGGRVADLDAPHPTVCASDDRRALVTPFVVPIRSGRNRSHRVEEPMATVAAGGNHGGLVVPLRSHTHAQPTDAALPTVTAGGNHHGLLMRNNLGGAEMVTPTDEPARTMTTKGHQSLLVPYYGHGTARPASEPIGTVRDPRRVRPGRRRAGRRRLRVPDARALRSRRRDGVPRRLHRHRADQEGPGQARRQRRHPAGHDLADGPGPASAGGGVMATCRWCPRPSTPDRLDCAVCDVRRALRPTLVCALGHHADCVGRLGADARYVDPYGLCR